MSTSMSTPTDPVHRGPRKTRLRDVSWPTAELGLVLAGAAVSAWLVHLFLVATNFDPLSEVAGGFGPLWAALMLAIAVGAQLIERLGRHPARARMYVALLAGTATGFVTGPLPARLRGPDQPLNTILGGH